MGKKTGKLILVQNNTGSYWRFRTKATMFDSAPSDIVFNEVKKWCKGKGIDLTKERGICPQQRRYSRECGIFIIGFILARALRRAMIGGIVSLQEVWNKLANKEHHQQQQQQCSMLCSKKIWLVEGNTTNGK